MENTLATRLDLLQAATRKGDEALARQRQLIDDLRSAGYRTAKAEHVLQKV
jgi:hypothetical protein